MMDSMHNEMYVSHCFVVEEMSLAVKEEPMQKVLHQTEKEYAEQEKGEKLDKIYSSPVDIYCIVDNNRQGHKENIVPLVMGEHLQAIRLEHAW